MAHGTINISHNIVNGTFCGHLRSISVERRTTRWNNGCSYCYHPPHAATQYGGGGGGGTIPNIPTYPLSLHSMCNGSKAPNTVHFIDPLNAFLPMTEEKFVACKTALEVDRRYGNERLPIFMALGEKIASSVLHASTMKHTHAKKQRTGWDIARSTVQRARTLELLILPQTSNQFYLLL